MGILTVVLICFGGVFFMRGTLDTFVEIGKFREGDTNSIKFFIVSALLGSFSLGAGVSLFMSKTL